MSLMKALARPAGRSLGQQARGFRYRGNMDLDTASPWYWLPMEAPNYSQLPERWDWYTFIGYGQEKWRFQYNPGSSGDHERMGRRYMTLFSCFACYALIVGGLWYTAKLNNRVVYPDEDTYVVYKQWDWQKYPFDNIFLYQPNCRVTDPNYQRHINSTGTF